MYICTNEKQNTMEKQIEYLDKFLDRNLEKNKYFNVLGESSKELLRSVLREKLYTSPQYNTAMIAISIATIPFLGHENLLGSFVCCSIDYPEEDAIRELRDEILALDFPTPVRDQALNISMSTRKVVEEGLHQVFYNWIWSYNKKVSKEEKVKISETIYLDYA